MNIDQSINILWLSDIHFNSEYTKDKTSDDFNFFVDSFIQYIGELNKINKFNYLIISGDIAQSGEKDEYLLFKNLILDPLIRKLPNNISLLLVPGNHDVKRASAEKYINKFLSNSSKRLDFLKKETNDFKNTFNSYSEAFRDYSIIPNNNSSLKDNNLLFGHVLDKEKKALFILLNSSWYSVGDDGFLRQYMEESIFSFDENTLKESIKSSIKKDYNEEKIDFDDFKGFLTETITIFSDIKSFSGYLKGKIRDKVDFFEVRKDNFLSKVDDVVNFIIELIKDDIVHKVSEISNEYGKQLVGLEVFEDEIRKMLELISIYNDYVILTIMHHPINWLNWEERIPYNGDKFHEIKKHTDILLTGHEHVPKAHRTELMNDSELLHIQAGCFMNYQNPKDFKIKDNWFSTLKVNVNKRTVTRVKHYFETNNWVQYEESEYRKLDKKYTTKLSEKRKDEISKSNIDYKKLVSCQKIEFEEIKKDIFKSKNRIFIFINDTKDEKLGVSFNELKNMIINKNSNEICFVFMDINHICYKDYCELEIDKMKVLDKIKNDIDFKFDRFRHLFFSSLSKKEVSTFIELKFINIIKPYWEIETCLTS